MTHAQGSMTQGKADHPDSCPHSRGRVLRGRFIITGPYNRFMVEAILPSNRCFKGEDSRKF